MLGWFNAAAARASCSKRRKRSGSDVRDSGRTLIATSRSSLVSYARYTSPIPPAPSGERISYCPRIVFGASVMGENELYLCGQRSLPPNVFSQHFVSRTIIEREAKLLHVLCG